MIISRGRNFVFVHIPKTGGTSLALALEARAMKDDLLIGDTPKARKRKRKLEGLRPRGRLWKHSTLADIDGILAPGDLAEMFIFTLVRNPWDRLVSYYHWLREQSFDHPSVEIARSTTFDAFLRSEPVQSSLRNAPASHYMRDVTGVERCNAFVRLERFEQDAARLETHLGFALSLPHINRSKRNTDYREYYDAETRALVADVCAEDIARFDYRFEPDE
ncbi:sulfotransferase family 2 domain-containing protein [uncultured Roseobacter sp.]|uniref:sulfotransferase family 2 domain-containing protein n=1 Tax=uncultured Roseobacter sp. TaxID=114847 RepID=UPI002623D66E|nr:sulfotransferase family 2 domain-containing protein [uncultured Roseobacter sp.]